MPNNTILKMLYVKYSNPEESLNSPFGNHPLMASLFNDAPDAVFVLNSKDYSIIDCNRRAVDMFEAETKSSLINLSSFRLYDSEPIELSKNILEMNIKNGGEHTQELAFRTIKQNVFWGKLIKRVVKSDNEEFIVLRISKAVDYLNTEEVLSTLLRGTAKVTGNKFFKELSFLLCRTFDVKYAFIGKISNNKKNLKIVESCGPLDDSGFDKYALQGTLVENVLKGYTTFYPSGSFDLFPNDSFVVKNKIEGFMGTPVFGNSGDVIGLIAFMHDKPIQEIPNSRYILSIFASRTAAEFLRMRSKELLKEQTRNLANANHLKDILLSVISHDLINPMHNVMGFTELLRNMANSYSKEKIVERVEIIDNSVKNIYFQLENLNDWSGIFSEKIRLNTEHFQLFEMIDDELSLFKFIIEIKELSIEKDLSFDPMMNTDKHMIGSIIRNMISNAVKYTPKGGTINITAKEERDDIVIMIKDTGIGMAQEDIEFYMNIISNIQDIPLNQNQTTGLGLLLSKTFADRIGGKIRIESRLNSGTTIYLTIPKA